MGLSVGNYGKIQIMAQSGSVELDFCNRCGSLVVDFVAHNKHHLDETEIPIIPRNFEKPSTYALWEQDILGFILDRANDYPKLHDATSDVVHLVSSAMKALRPL